MAPTELFFTLLANVEFQVGKRKLRTWQNMAWKALLLLSALCQSSQFAVYMCIKMAPAGKFLIFTFLLIIGALDGKRAA